MSNGRMTFRFDVEKDKPDMKERWTSSGLKKNVEYNNPDQLTEFPQDSYSHYYDVQEPPPSYSYPEVHSDMGGEDYSSLPFDEEKNWFRNRPSEHAQNSIQYDDVPLSDGVYNSAYHSRRPFNGWKFAASITAAIGIGLLFGYVALSFFRNGDLPSTSVSVASNQVADGGQNTGALSDPAGVGTSGDLITGENSENTLSSIPVQIAGQSYYLLQYGVFSTTQGASQASQELLTAGLAAGLDPSDGNRVYAGISPDREQAKLLSNGLKSQGIELYVREVTIPATVELTFGGTAETVNHYFEVSGKILGEMSSMSASLLSHSSTVKHADVSSLHMEWTEAIKSLESGSSPTALKIIAEQQKTVNQGISALNEYNKNESDGLLWEVQGAMMNFLTGQKELLSALK